MKNCIYFTNTSFVLEDLPFNFTFLFQRADFAITDLTITSTRQKAVDFTSPFMNLGITILYKKPTKQPPDLFSFISPFSYQVNKLHMLC